MGRDEHRRNDGRTGIRAEENPVESGTTVTFENVGSIVAGDGIRGGDRNLETRPVVRSRRPERRLPQRQKR
ncbi:hypothetical protein C8039_01995 [Halogeometricum sp. wsp3]|nr:hypothetical protein C8039_01995 [Halogeometricum sp. wsp3]